MKNFKTVLITTVIAIALLGCTKEEILPSASTDDVLTSGSTDAVLTSSLLKSAVKPAAKLTGEFYIELAYNPDIPPANLTWDGTISFEGYGEYGYRFFSLGGRYPGQSFHFNEIYEFYDLTTGEVLLSGHDKGVSAPTLKQPEPEMFRILGDIEYVKEGGPFEMWLGRKINVKGTVYFLEISTPDGPVVVPTHCYGELRIN